MTHTDASHKRRAVFLDRDGTLNLPVVRNGKPYPPKTFEEFRLYDDVPATCEKLKAAAYALVVVTNQPDVGRGTQTIAAVETLHTQLLSLVPSLDRIEVCYAPGQDRPHPDNSRRKPAPGMLLDAAAALNLDLSTSWMVGDRWGDIDAGHAAGCRTILIDRNYAERPPKHQPGFVAKSLAEAAGIILAHT